MLIKTKDQEGKWILFDNAEEVRYDTTLESIKHQRELGFLVDPDDQVHLTVVLPDVDMEAISDTNPLKVGIIKFVRLGKRYVVVFNTVTYICNDQGKTVEKVAINEDTKSRYTEDRHSQKEKEKEEERQI